jgi:hypothetical protein
MLILLTLVACINFDLTSWIYSFHPLGPHRCGLASTFEQKISIQSHLAKELMIMISRLFNLKLNWFLESTKEAQYTTPLKVSSCNPSWAVI